MQELRVIDPVLTNLDPEFEVNLFIDQIPDFLAGGRADGLDAFPRPADDHGLVRGLRHIDGGMDEHAIVFLVPHFNVHGDGIGDFLIQLFEKLLADDLGGHELHGGRGKLIFGELRLAFGQVGADKLKELLHTVAAQGRRREDFRLGEHLGHGLQQGQHTRLVMEQVDLVHHNDDGALLFGQRLDEGREIALHEIGLAQVQIAVDDEHDTVRHREALPRRLDHDLAELASGLAAQGVHAGRVHKNDLGILLGQDADDAVTGRLRLGRDDRHLLAHKGVGKGGFARIGRTHQRYPSTTVCCCHIVSSKTQKCWFHTSASERDVIKSQDAESAISWAGRRIRHSPGRTSTTSSSHTPSSRYTRQRPGRSS